MAYDNTNRIALWGNKDKETDSHPDFKGQLNIDGVEYWVSAWKRKEGANPASPALSGSIEAKEEKTEAHATTNQTGGSDGFDDIPFTFIDHRCA